MQDAVIIDHHNRTRILLRHEEHTINKVGMQGLIWIALLGSKETTTSQSTEHYWKNIACPKFPNSAAIQLDRPQKIKMQI
jgi:hypothetical protein